MTVYEQRIVGPPGTGKTTTLSRIIANAVQEFGVDKVLVTSFTKAAAVELISRGLPIPDSQVGTLHALAYRALGLPPIAETKIREWNEAWSQEQPSWAMSATAVGVDAGWDMSSKTEGDRAMAYLQTQRARMVPPREMRYESRHRDAMTPKMFQQFAMAWTYWKKSNGYLDFSDIIETALREMDEAPGSPRFMAVDEVQDCSTLEVTLLKQWAAHMERVVFVGDPMQAIYEFKGADPKALFGVDIDYGHQEVLEQSYRVPRAIHTVAMAWIKRSSWYIDAEYRPRDDDGRVEQLSGTSARYESPYDVVQRAEQLAAEGKSVAILATCSYMLRDTIAELKRRGLPFHNPFKPRRLDWNPLRPGTEGQKAAVDRLRAYMAIRPDFHVLADDAHIWSAAEFTLWISQIETGDVLKRGLKTRIAEKEFTLPAEPSARLAAIGDMMKDDAAGQLFAPAIDGDLDWLEYRLRGDGKRLAYPIAVAKRYGPRGILEVPRIVVGTAHSVKGSTVDAVFVYPDVSPQGRDEWQSGGERRDAVRRLFYVAMTRARESLYLCERSSQYAISWYN